MNGWKENDEGVWEKQFSQEVKGFISHKGDSWEGRLTASVRMQKGTEGPAVHPVNLPFPYCKMKRISDVMRAADDAYSEYKRVFS